MRHVQLRAFHHVAICGGFSRAAEALNVTQPAISDQIRKLEEEYDVLLFNRRKKQTVLTPAGRDLLEITNRLFEVERQALELLSESRALRSGSLRIIADSAHHIVHVLSAFRELHPRIDIIVHSGNTETVTARLHAYEADIGVVGGIPAGREFETIRLSSTPLIAFVARSHPLAAVGAIPLGDLVRHPLVLREKGSMTRGKIAEALAARGLAPGSTIEAEGREAVREIVAAGAGVGIVSTAEFDNDSRLVPIRLADCDIRMEEAIICRRERAKGRLIGAFLDVARRQVAAGQPEASARTRAPDGS